MIKITEVSSNDKIVRTNDMQEGCIYKRMDEDVPVELAKYFICNKLPDQEIVAFSICGKGILYSSFTDMKFIEMQADIVLKPLTVQN